MLNEEEIFFPSSQTSIEDGEVRTHNNNNNNNNSDENLFFTLASLIKIPEEMIKYDYKGTINLISQKISDGKIGDLRELRDIAKRVKNASAQQNNQSLNFCKAINYKLIFQLLEPNSFENFEENTREIVAKLILDLIQEDLADHNNDTYYTYSSNDGAFPLLHRLAFCILETRYLKDTLSIFEQLDWKTLPINLKNKYEGNILHTILFRRKNASIIPQLVNKLISSIDSQKMMGLLLDRNKYDQTAIEAAIAKSANPSNEALLALIQTIEKLVLTFPELCKATLNEKDETLLVIILKHKDFYPLIPIVALFSDLHHTTSYGQTALQLANNFKIDIPSSIQNIHKQLKDIAKLEQENKFLENDLELAKKEIDNQKKLQEELKQSLQEVESTFESESAELKNIKKEKEALTHKLRQSQDTVKRLQNELTTVKEEKNIVLMEKQKLLQEKESLTCELKVVTNERNNLQQRNITLENEKSELQQKLQQQEEKYLALLNEKKEMELKQQVQQQTINIPALMPTPIVQTSSPIPVQEPTMEVQADIEPGIAVTPIRLSTGNASASKLNNNSVKKRILLEDHPSEQSIQSPSTPPSNKRSRSQSPTNTPSTPINNNNNNNNHNQTPYSQTQNNFLFFNTDKTKSPKTPRLNPSNSSTPKSKEQSLEKKNFEFTYKPKDVHLDTFKYFDSKTTFQPEIIHLDSSLEEPTTKETGRWGEHVVYRYIKYRYKKKYSCKKMKIKDPAEYILDINDSNKYGRISICWLNKKEERKQSYDIEINKYSASDLSNPVKTRYVEVKATTKIQETDARFTVKEWNFFCSNKAKYRVHRLYGVGKQKHVIIKKMKDEIKDKVSAVILKI